MTDMTQSMGILGKVGFRQIESYILNQRVGRIKPKNEPIDFSFIYSVLCDDRFVKRMRTTSKGAVQNTLTLLISKTIIA